MRFYTLPPYILYNNIPKNSVILGVTSYPGGQEPRNIPNCYSFYGKGILAVRRQGIPTTLKENVCQQKCCSSVLVGDGFPSKVL